MVGLLNTDRLATKAEGAMFKSRGDVTFGKEVNDYGQAWWVQRIFDPCGVTPHELARKLAAAGVKPTAITWTDIDVGKGAYLRIDRPEQSQEIYLFDGRTLFIGGPGLETYLAFISDAAVGPGRLFAMLPTIVDAARSADVHLIEMKGCGVGRYGLLKTGFLPEHATNIALIKEALFQIARHQDRFDKAVLAELTRRIGCAGPASARIVAAIENPIPCHYLPEDFGVPRTAAFGRWLLIECFHDWEGHIRYDEDCQSMAVLRESVVPPHRYAVEYTGPTLWPKSDVWGPLERNTAAPVGADGQAWHDAVSAAWLQAGGTNGTFAEIFPKLAQLNKNLTVQQDIADCSGTDKGPRRQR